MKPNYIFSSLTALLLLFAATSFCYANDGHVEMLVNLKNCCQLAPMLSDTVPEAKKIPETKTDSGTNSTVIKEVPKSKKQLAPVALPVIVKVKPIKIIKPKINKPVIKIN